MWIISKLNWRQCFCYEGITVGERYRAASWGSSVESDPEAVQASKPRRGLYLDLARPPFRRPPPRTWWSRSSRSSPERFQPLVRRNKVSKIGLAERVGGKRLRTTVQDWQLSLSGLKPEQRLRTAVQLLHFRPGGSYASSIETVKSDLVCLGCELNWNNRAGPPFLTKVSGRFLGCFFYLCSKLLKEKVKHFWSSLRQME